MAQNRDSLIFLGLGALVLYALTRGIAEAASPWGDGGSLILAPPGGSGGPKSGGGGFADLLRTGGQVVGVVGAGAGLIAKATGILTSGGSTAGAGTAGAGAAASTGAASLITVAPEAGSLEALVAEAPELYGAGAAPGEVAEAAFAPALPESGAAPYVPQPSPSTVDTAQAIADLLTPAPAASTVATVAPEVGSIEALVAEAPELYGAGAALGEVAPEALVLPAAELVTVAPLAGSLEALVAEAPLLYGAGAALGEVAPSVTAGAAGAAGGFASAALTAGLFAVPAVVMTVLLALNPTFDEAYQQFVREGTDYLRAHPDAAAAWADVFSSGAWNDVREVYRVRYGDYGWPGIEPLQVSALPQALINVGYQGAVQRAGELLDATRPHPDLDFAALQAQYYSAGEGTWDPALFADPRYTPGLQNWALGQDGVTLPYPSWWDLPTDQSGMTPAMASNFAAAQAAEAIRIAWAVDYTNAKVLPLALSESAALPDWQAYDELWHVYYWGGGFGWNRDALSDPRYAGALRYATAQGYDIPTPTFPTGQRGGY